MGLTQLISWRTKKDVYQPLTEFEPVQGRQQKHRTICALDIPFIFELKNDQLNSNGTET